VRHVDELAHQPHAPIEVHVPHANAADRHGSGGAQSPDDQRQSPHELPVGPVELPLRQLLVLAHQPHALMPVHEPQLAEPAEHGSEDVHEDEYHAHPLEQLALVGPVELPLRHCDDAPQ